MQLFGQTIKETGKGLNNPTEKIQAIGRIIISIILLIISFLLIFGTETKSVGELILGAILGYWLK